ncbi:MAG: hypothetical protein K6C99_06365 [Lachnospiraceae bacterium]|nr:hypothetical protein [Lachnospiraceae bacterium]
MPVEIIEKSSDPEKRSRTDLPSDEFSELSGSDFEYRYLKNGKSPRSGSSIRLDPGNGSYSRRGGKDMPQSRSFLVRPGNFLRLYKPLIFVMLISVLAIFLSKRAGYLDTGEHLDSIMIDMESLSGENENEEIPLRYLGYYIVKTELDGDQTAREYDSSDPKAYWNLYMNQDGQNSGYVSDLARDAVLNYCIRDIIYSDLAKKNGYKLNEELLTETDYDAASFYADLSDRAKAKTGLTEDEVRVIMENEALAHSYMLELASLSVKDGLASNSLEAVNELYDINGSYYKNLLSDYKITINTDEWNKVRIGFVTIN